MPRKLIRKVKQKASGGSSSSRSTTLKLSKANGKWLVVHGDKTHGPYDEKMKAAAKLRKIKREMKDMDDDSGGGRAKRYAKKAAGAAKKGGKRLASEVGEADPQPPAALDETGAFGMQRQARDDDTPPAVSSMGMGIDPDPPETSIDPSLPMGGGGVDPQAPPAAIDPSIPMAGDTDGGEPRVPMSGFFDEREPASDPMGGPAFGPVDDRDDEPATQPPFAFDDDREREADEYPWMF